MKKHEIEILNDGDEIEVRSRRYDFEKMAKVLLEGGTFFVPNIKRGSAKYVRTELEKLLGRYVEYTHGFHTNKDGAKEEGYVFEFDRIKQQYVEAEEE